MRLPKLFYELYPVMYVIGGIAAMNMVESTVSFLCGLLLGVGGVAILFLRRNYRATKDQLIQST